MRTVCVFCGSSTGGNLKYIKAARELGRYLAENELTLVYGAGNVGLMGQIAQSALECGGKVIGVIPEFLRTEELAHEGLTEMIVTQTMHERKIEMGRRADAFAVLPGGFGTMDEFFEILTWRQLGLHAKPINVANTGGWFDPILTYFRHAENLRMVSRENLALVEVVGAGEKIVETLLRRQDPAGSLPRLSRS